MSIHERVVELQNKFLEIQKWQDFAENWMRRIESMLDSTVESRWTCPSCQDSFENLKEYLEHIVAKLVDVENHLTITEELDNRISNIEQATVHLKGLQQLPNLFNNQTHIFEMLENLSKRVGKIEDWIQRQQELSKKTLSVLQGAKDETATKYGEMVAEFLDVATGKLQPEPLGFPRPKPDYEVIADNESTEEPEDA